MFLVNFSKVQQLSNNLSRKRGYIDLKIEGNLTADTDCFCGKNCGFLDCFLGTEVTDHICVDQNKSD